MRKVRSEMYIPFSPNAAHQSSGDRPRSSKGLVGTGAVIPECPWGGGCLRGLGFARLVAGLPLALLTLPKRFAELIVEPVPVAHNPALRLILCNLG